MKSIKLLVALATCLPLFAFKQPAQIHSFTSKKTKTMVIEKQVVINADIEKSWKILGVEFAHADRWASAVSHSEGKGASFSGATCSERSCSTTMGGLKEKLLDFSHEKHRLKYEVAEGMPSMVRHATNDWQLTSIGGNQSRLTMVVEMEVGGLMGTLMKPMLRSKMSKMMAQLGEEFKYYVENGQPHARKLKVMRKA